jgi:hypothetical protein
MMKLVKTRPVGNLENSVHKILPVGGLVEKTGQKW